MFSELEGRRRAAGAAERDGVHPRTRSVIRTRRSRMTTKGADRAELLFGCRGMATGWRAVPWVVPR